MVSEQYGDTWPRDAYITFPVFLCTSLGRACCQASWHFLSLLLLWSQPLTTSQICIFNNHPISVSSTSTQLELSLASPWVSCLTTIHRSQSSQTIPRPLFSTPSPCSLLVVRQGANHRAATIAPDSLMSFLGNGLQNPVRSTCDVQAHMGQPVSSCTVIPSPRPQGTPPP